MEPAQQLAFEAGAGGFRSGMPIIPDGKLLGFEDRVIAFDDRFLEAEFEVAVEPRIKGGAGNGIVVVREVLASLEHYIVRAPIRV